MKFCFRVGEKAETLEEAMKGLDRENILHYLGTLRAGDRMHLIVRPRPGFDVVAKRNYFHGPMLTWICKTIRDTGIPCPREQMRAELVKRFVGVDEDGVALSVANTLEVKTEGDPRDPETKYGEFISDVRNWCRDVLHSEPPWPDQVDLDEESTTCAKPEMT